jgi:hypothetical protein
LLVLFISLFRIVSVVYTIEEIIDARESFGMIRGNGFLAILALLAIGWNNPCPADEPDSSQAKPIQLLIKQLGSSTYKQRDEATRLLEKQGAKVLESLREATKSKDLEVSKRATLLVEKIEKELETQLTLAPTKIHLVCKNTPVKDAVAELARLSGTPIQITGDQSKLANRKITLDTGETTFWQAFDQLCQKAGLHEMPVSTTSSPYDYYQLDKLVKDASKVSYDNSLLPSLRRLTVQDGAPASVPTCYLGALRIQAKPMTKLLGTEVPSGTPTFDLCVSPEPRLRWHNLLELRPTKVLDAKGKPLAEGSIVRLEPVVDRPGYEAAMILEMEKMRRESGYFARSMLTKQHTSWGLKLPEAKETVLKELNGQLVAKVDTPPKTLATVNNILKASGQKVKTDGGSIKVLSVAPYQESGLRIHVRMETPITSTAFAGAPAGAQGLVRRVLQVKGNLHLVYLSADQAARGPENFTLVDIKGKPFRQEAVGQPTSATLNDKNDAEVREFQLTFMPNKGQAQPDRLIFSASHTITVQVPFVLQNVNIAK